LADITAGSELLAAPADPAELGHSLQHPRSRWLAQPSQTRPLRPGRTASGAWQHGRMRERDAPGEPGQSRQVAAVTGAWLPGLAPAGRGAGPAGTARAPGGPGAGPAAAGARHGPGAEPAAAGAPGGPEFLINLGSAHPSAPGMLRLRLTLEGDRITAAEPEIGFMHRGAEKLFEARDYRQIIVLANRHDWLGAFASELGVVLAAERLAGIEVPPRAVWARTLLAELNRVLSHLAFLSAYPPEIAEEPGQAGAQAAFRAREAIQSIMEEI